MGKITKVQLKLISLLIISLFITGCEQYNTFSHVYQKKLLGTKISQIQLKAFDPKIDNFCKIALAKAQFKITTTSDYILIPQYANYPKKCNNPLATANQKSYRGFVKLTLEKEGKKIYTCQLDFKQELSQKHLNYLLELLIDEMQLKR
ncbi:MAG: hypothetical protein K0U47_07225 [Epsilonproteobacteria bacterium]|nr:hypothetical protein [Campylobacterota bacterium]